MFDFPILSENVFKIDWMAVCQFVCDSTNNKTKKQNSQSKKKKNKKKKKGLEAGHVKIYSITDDDIPK